jgi:hypothetical protein
MIILHNGTGGDLSHVQAMASIEEGFALFDYVWIDQGNMAWIGQILIARMVVLMLWVNF